MPKLSIRTLEKRFHCDYCGETFRTRQGLSGHIQFKHQAFYGQKNRTTKIDLNFILPKLKYLQAARLDSTGLSSSTINTVTKLLVNWGNVRIIFKLLGVELTDQDFKTYLLLGLGKIFS